MEQSSDDMREAGFLNAVVLAGYGFVAATGKDPKVEGAELAKHLLADRPLSRAERELLAGLVTGEWLRPEGRAIVSPSNPLVVKVVKRLRELVEDKWPVEAAKKKITEEFPIGRTTVDNYEKMVIAREQAKERGKSIRSPK